MDKQRRIDQEGRVKGSRIITANEKREIVGGEIQQVFIHKENETNPIFTGLKFKYLSYISYFYTRVVY